MSKLKGANSDSHGLQSPRCVVDKICYGISLMGICHEIPWQLFQSRFVIFVVIDVSVLCEPSCNSDALSSILHMRIHAPIDFIHNIFLLSIFPYFLEFIFQRKLLLLPCHLRYNNSVKIKGVSKVLLGWSHVMVLRAYRTIQSNVVCDSFKYSGNYYRW